MNESHQDHFRFRLTRTPSRVSITKEEFEDGAQLQRSLFPSPKPGLMIFVYFPDVTELELRQTLEYSKPAFVVELRATPRFDIGRFNREQAFHIFAQQNSTYLDLTSEFMGKGDTNGPLKSLK